MLSDWWWAFVLTQAIEAPLYARWAWGLGCRGWRVGGWALCASTLTHPIVWFVIPPLVYAGAWEPRDAQSYVWMIALAEAFAVCAEAGYWRLILDRFSVSWSHTLIASLAVNGSSVAVGAFTRWLIDWP